MKTCNECGQDVLENPYRDGPTKSVSTKNIIWHRFKNLKPFINKISTILGSRIFYSLIAIMTCVVLYGAFWVLFPGAYRLGNLIGNDVCHFGLPTDWRTPAPILTWFFGQTIVTGWLWLPAIGRFIATVYRQRNKWQ